MPGMVFVHGGDPLAREVLQREQRGEWSQALPIVLEKWGYLCFEEAGPASLGDAETFEHYDTVLVARMPEGTWTEEVVERVRAGRAQVLADGPLPAPVLAALGVECEGPVKMVGGIVVSDPVLHAAARDFGVAPGAALAPPDRQPTDGAPAPDDLAPEHTAAWRRQGWDVERWKAPAGTTVHAEWVAPDDVSFRFPAVVRAGNLTGCSFGLFAFLAQRHTAEPYDGAERRSSSRSAGLEAMLLALIDRLHRLAGVVRPRVLPWPRAAQWALAELREPPAEFHGASTVLAAQLEGRQFIEFLEHSHYHPHRFAALEPTGELRAAGVVCLPHRETLPRKRGRPTAAAALVERWSNAGGYLQVDAPLVTAPLRLAPSEAADWWHRSHRRDRLKLRALGRGRFELVTTEPVEGLVLELLHPDGSRAQHAAIATARPQPIAADPRAASLPVAWDETHPIYAEIVGRVFAGGGQVGPGVVGSATVANETTATPSRGEFLIGLMHDLGGLDLRGRRALDVGCGFGTVAAYVAWRTGSARMLATDLSSQRIGEAREGARRTGLDAVVEYDVADVSDLVGIEDESFDAVIALGVLMYLDGRS